MKDEDIGTELLLGCVGFVLLPFFALWSGWVLSCLWAWFAVPAGLPPITLKTAIGIDLLVSFAAHQHVPDQTSASHIVWHVTRPAFFLGIGWLMATVLS